MPDLLAVVGGVTGGVMLGWLAFLAVKQGIAWYQESEEARAEAESITTWLREQQIRLWGTRAR